MKMVQKGVQLSVIIIGSFLSPGLFAQDDHPDLAANTKLSLDDNFRTGWHEFSLGSGVEITCITGYGRPIVNYVMGFAEAGYFVYDTAGSGFLRGNLELVPEAFGSSIFTSTTSGNYIAGGSLYFRYNFIQPGWRLVPYFQGGGGGTAMDINHRYDGMNYNFNLGMAAGVRCLVDRHCSVNLEALFQHISNADLGAHNIGLNSAGPRLGISWFF